MRVLVLSHYFPPEPIFKPLVVAEALAARGHEVTVVTGFPNYPSGKLYLGYRQSLIQRETIKGISVIRTPIYPSHDRSSLGRMLNYCSFIFSSLWGAIAAPPCDVIYVWHPPLTIGIASWLIGVIKQAPFVYDLQDIWPESGVWSGMLKNERLIRVLHSLESFIYRRAKYIFVVTEGARRNLIDKGVPADKIFVVSQLIDENLFGKPDTAKIDALDRELSLASRFVVMFAGNIGLLQGLDAAIDAAAMIQDNPRVLFVFVGDGVDRERLMRKSQQMGLKNVLFVGPRPETDMPYFMAAADAMLLTLNYSEVCEVSIPLKTFAYLASSRPIVAAIRGAAADLVEKAKAGIIVPPEDSQAIAEAIRKLMAMDESQRRAMGLSGRNYIVANHAKERMLDRHVEVIERACVPA